MTRRDHDVAKMMMMIWMTKSGRREREANSLERTCWPQILWRKSEEGKDASSHPVIFIHPFEKLSHDRKL